MAFWIAFSASATLPELLTCFWAHPCSLSNSPGSLIPCFVLSLAVRRAVSRGVWIAQLLLLIRAQSAQLPPLARSSLTPARFLIASAAASPASIDILNSAGLCCSTVEKILAGSTTNPTFMWGCQVIRFCRFCCALLAVLRRPCLVLVRVLACDTSHSRACRARTSLLSPCFVCCCGFALS